MGNSSDSAAKAAFDAALGEYFRRLNGGEKLDTAAFVASHPDVADELRAYFASSGILKQGRQSIDAPDASATHTLGEARGVSSQETIPPQKPTGGSSSAQLASQGGLAGQVFGRYEIVRVLGQGAMGVVYLARDTELHREVALKVPKFTENDSPALIERFYRESRSAAALQHRNICPIFDIGEAGGTRYITMAYIEGHPLSHYISRDRRQPLRLIAGVVRKLALALAAAHERGIVHRDLKPANILVDASKEPVIMDFGLARQLNRPDDARITQSGVLVGSPAYMSPEQVESRLDEIGPASDIFSLGIILYEFMTGELPFQGSIAVVLGKIVAVTPANPSAKRADIDSTLEGICLRMMAKRIPDRYASMDEVAAALTAYLKNPPASSATKHASTNDDSSLLNSDPERRTTVTDAKKATQPSDDALLQTARDCVQEHDYERGLELLSQIPAEHRTDQVLRLQESTQRLQDEVDILLADLEESRHRRRAEGLQKKVDRLRALKPGHPYIRQFENQTSIGRTAADNRHADPFARFVKQYKSTAAAVSLLVVAGVAAAIFWPQGDSDSEASKPSVAQAGPSDIEPLQKTAESDDDKKVAPVVEKPVAPPTLHPQPLERVDSAQPSQTKPEYVTVAAGEPLLDQRQTRAAEQLHVPVKFENTIGMSLVLIPAGEFRMGTPYEDHKKVLANRGIHNQSHLRSEKPTRQVRIANPFYCGTCEVTRGQFAKFVEVKGYQTSGERDRQSGVQNFGKREGVRGTGLDWRKPGFAQTDRDPVVGVSVEDAQAFCKWLSETEGRRYRLPREAEWEYACRAGTTTLYYTGDDANEMANSSNTGDPNDSFKTTSPVGSFRQNPFGLYDMIGNVWEICSDFGTADYSAHSAEGEPPTSANHSQVVTRGGAADCPIAYCRSAVRGLEDRKSCGNNVGFRIVCDVAR